MFCHMHMFALGILNPDILQTFLTVSPQLNDECHKTAKCSSMKRPKNDYLIDNDNITNLIFKDGAYHRFMVT